MPALQAAKAPRNGPARMADIPAALLDQLNAGQRETATLVEGLAIDFAALMRAVAPEAGDPLARLPAGAGITRRMQAAGASLLDCFGPAAFDRFAAHQADTVRGWAAYALAATPDLALAERLDRIRPLADDPHFGVREWAWIALRPHIAADLAAAIDLLAPWTAESSANLRRFAVEISRPRGVWCAHIAALKADPAPGLPLLEPVRADPARYVQDSAANWLNDAAKSQPAWVRDLCARWLDGSDDQATRRICQRATRSL